MYQLRKLPGSFGAGIRGQTAGPAASIGWGQRVCVYVVVHQLKITRVNALYGVNVRPDHKNDLEEEEPLTPPPVVSPPLSPPPTLLPTADSIVTIGRFATNAEVTNRTHRARANPVFPVG